LGVSEDRVRSMAMIHEQLYSHDDMSAVDVAVYTRGLAAALFSSYSAGALISYRLEAASIMLTIEQAIPCGLILNELITNALRYAYPDKRGQIFIGLAREGDYVSLTVSDEGIGIPKGFDLETSKSLGLMLVRLLANQLGGGLQIGTGCPGSSFIVRFKTQAPYLAALPVAV
jgi:two-component sensor histidine kinase